MSNASVYDAKPSQDHPLLGTYWLLVCSYNSTFRAQKRKRRKDNLHCEAYALIEPNRLSIADPHVEP